MKGLIDSTLREGEQMAGVYFTTDQKIEIVTMLGKIGVEEIELGVGVGDPEMKTLAAKARLAAPHARLAVWCRCLDEDIKCACDLKPDVLSLSVPVSHLHVNKRLGKDRAWVLSQVENAVARAKTYGISYISLGIEDATRADQQFLRCVFGQAVRAGVDRVRFSDTLGLATPADILYLASKFAEQYDVEIGIHTHNDFGMATANAITALEAGFEWADASVLGLGERAGIARLEEMLTWLRTRYAKTHYDLKSMRSLCRTVAGLAGLSIYPHHTGIGDTIFACESGLHIDGLVKAVETYEPYAPELVNDTRKTMLGKKTGRSAVANKMMEMGIPVSDEKMALLVTQIKTKSRHAARPLKDAEIQSLAQAVVGG
ncbi:MAG: LeuA family protein [Armatimonadota bacterium]